jgi:hypothetical protein
MSRLLPTRPLIRGCSATRQSWVTPLVGIPEADT